MNKAQLFFRKHSSTILTVVGAGGVIATSVLAVKATPKAMELIEEEKESRKEYKTILSDNEPYETVIMPELTKLEIVKIAWKPYIPAVITGVSTIACIFGANVLNKRQQASLMSAYAVLDNSYREFVAKAKELYDEHADTKIRQEIAKSKLDEDIQVSEDKELFWDYQSLRFFESTFDEVKHAEKVFNENYVKSGFACLNDYYELLGLEPVDYGYQIGWNSDLQVPDLEFIYEKTVLDDGLECWIITMPCPPSTDYVC